MSIRLLTASAVALGLVAFIPAAHAQDAATVQQAIVVRDAAMRSNIAMDYVTQLTTRFGARPAGSRSEQQAAGWAADDVTAGEAGSEFATTTVFYSDVADEGAARGLAQAIGGAAVELSDAYAGLAGDESVKQLVVVIGTDRTDAGAATTAP